jgi:hypothetical protein
VLGHDFVKKADGSFCTKMPLFILPGQQTASWRITAWWRSAILFIPCLMPAHFFFFPQAKTALKMMMITGHQRHEEACNCQMKYSSFGCFQWLCMTAFRKM